MRTTVSFDRQLFEAASRIVGTDNRSEVLRQALEALVERDAARRLAQLGGSDKQAMAGSRRQSAPAR